MKFLSYFLLWIPLFPLFPEVVVVDGSSIKNAIISRIYIQSTLAHLAEEIKIELPFTLMTNTNLQELPTEVHDVLTNNHGEFLVLGTLLLVIFAKYCVVVNVSNVLVEIPTEKWKKKLYPFIEINHITNQTKTVLLCVMIWLFRNVAEVR